MKQGEVLKQRDAFKKKHGEWPAFPIKIKYRFSGTECKGKIDLAVGTPSIFGFHGIMPITDGSITNLKMIEDATGKKF